MDRYDSVEEAPDGGREVRLAVEQRAVQAGALDMPVRAGASFEESSSVDRPTWAWALKRTFDIVLAGIGLVLLAPYFLYAAARIKLDSPGPVFFRQPRIGRRENPFTLLKFRTMWEDADVRKSEFAGMNSRTDGLFKVRDDPRVTDYGRGLRRFALDELPQLINVLRGDMSLVGPRPLIPAESALVGGRYRLRFAVRPGITGPWQAGPIDVPLSGMLELDCDYARSWTVHGDMMLLLRTVRAIVHRRHGAY